MKKSKSSKAWLREHEEDEYVQRARRDGLRSRASYKLLEINEKTNLLKKGMSVIDLGADPGGWSQVVKQVCGAQAEVIALDILPMEPIGGVTFIQGDFTEQGPLDKLMSMLNGRRVDLVISDMAPNLSGMKQVDQPRAAYLVELAIEMSVDVLQPGGSLIAKCFEGSEINSLRNAFKKRFKKVTNVKPRASRARSKEIYLVGSGFQLGEVS